MCIVNVIAPEINKIDQEYKPVYGISPDGKIILKNLIVIPEEHKASDLVSYSDVNVDSYDAIETGSVVWQLFNQCSKGFLQVDDTINARGSTSSSCKSKF